MHTTLSRSINVKGRDATLLTATDITDRPPLCVSVFTPRLLIPLANRYSPSVYTPATDLRVLYAQRYRQYARQTRRTITYIQRTDSAEPARDPPNRGSQEEKSRQKRKERATAESMFVRLLRVNRFRSGPGACRGAGVRLRGRKGAPTKAAIITGADPGRCYYCTTTHQLHTTKKFI